MHHESGAENQAIHSSEIGKLVAAIYSKWWATGAADCVRLWGGANCHSLISCGLSGVHTMYVNYYVNDD